MKSRSDEIIRQVTSELRDEITLEKLISTPDIKYRSVPLDHADPSTHPTWRVRFDLAFDSNITIGLDLNGEVTLGRDPDGPGYVSLFSSYDAERLGVSRHHILLRPTETKLYIIDLESTNGTWINGHTIGVNTPYSLSHGDRVMCGRLEFDVKIIKRPSGHTAALVSKAELSDALVPVARAITSQLDLKEALKQAIEMTVSLTASNEAAIWLVDEQSGEIILEAAQGLDESQGLRLSMTDSLAGKVISTGKPLRVNSSSGGEQIKVKTGYLVEAILYVPLTLGGVTFGVLSAAHREPGKMFSLREEKLVAAIADFTAIAIHNARAYRATDSALTRRGKVLTALNYALSYDLKNLIKSVVGYTGLLQSYSLDEETADLTDQLFFTGNRLSQLAEKLIEITALSEDPRLNMEPCDLIEVVNRALEEMQAPADIKSTQLSFQLIGDPYLIYGDSSYLYRSILHLLDNAIKYSPRGAEVNVAIVFWHNNVTIRVRDTGPGIPEEDLPHLFDRYYRGKGSADSQAGMGLGLEFVRTTAESHRGTLTARNAQDQGAEFVITLPISLRVG